MKKLKHYLPPLLLAMATAAQAADPLPPKVTGDEKVPVIKLPDEKPRNVVKFDAVGVREVPWHVVAVKAPEAWAKNSAARGKGLKVAIIDTHAQRDHPAYADRVKGQYDAINKRVDPPSPIKPHPHGTHCTGIVHSIAPDADLYLITVLGDDGSGAVDVIAHGIDYATTVFQVDVISLSLGGSSPDTFMPPAIARAVAAGVVVVAAAGNEGPGDNTEGYPGRYSDVVSVAASNSDKQLAAFSSRGPNVFTTDPGVDILSTLPGNNEGLMSGTSMACPCEAGKVASWIASNAALKDKGRRDAYRKAVVAASPFAERNNARGYGLYTLDKITGTASQPPAPDKPKRPFTVTIGLSDLSAAKQAELAAGGVTTFRLEVGHGDRSAAPAAPPVVPVQAVPPVGTITFPPGTFPPGAIIGPVIPGQWQPATPHPWHTLPPATVPQQMPAPVYLPYQPFPNVRHVIGLPVQQCPGGVCPRR